MSYTLILDGLDVTDYVTDLSEVQFYARNEDYVPINDDMDFKLSNSYLREFPGTVFENNAPVLIYSESVLLFNGFIVENTHLVDEFEYKYIAEQKIQGLKEYLLSIDDMWTEVSESSDDKTVYGFPSTRQFITVDNLIDAIFSKIGLSVDYTYKTSENVYSVPYLSGSLVMPVLAHPPDHVVFQESAKSFVPGDLYLFLPQLMCLNQEGIYTKEQIDGDETLRANRVTLYDLLNKLLMITGYTMIPKDSTSYYAANDRTNPTRNVNFETQYELYYTLSETNGVTNEYLVPWRQYSNYAFYTFMRVVSTVQPPPTGVVYGYGIWYESPGLSGDVINHVSSYYNNAEGEDSEVKWYNHLIFWELPDYAGYGSHANIIMPSFFGGTSGLFNRTLMAKMGNATTQEYENLVNTEKVSAVSNYIKIDNTHNGETYSAIKTTSYELPIFDGAG